MVKSEKFYNQGGSQRRDEELGLKVTASQTRIKQKNK